MKILRTPLNVRSVTIFMLMMTLKKEIMVMLMENTEALRLDIVISILN